MKIKNLLCFIPASLTAKYTVWFTRFRFEVQRSNLKNPPVYANIMETGMKGNTSIL